MPGLWWNLSFAELKPPHGRGFLGGVLTEADTLADAVSWTHVSGLNPGGSMAAVCFRSSMVDPAYVDRLLDRAEQLALPMPPDAMPVADAPLGVPWI